MEKVQSPSHFFSALLSLWNFVVLWGTAPDDLRVPTRQAKVKPTGWTSKTKLCTAETVETRRPLYSEKSFWSRRQTLTKIEEKSERWRVCKKKNHSSQVPYLFLSHLLLFSSWMCVRVDVSSCPPQSKLPLTGFFPRSPTLSERHHWLWRILSLDLLIHDLFTAYPTATHHVTCWWHFIYKFLSTHLTVVCWTSTATRTLERIYRLSKRSFSVAKVKEGRTHEAKVRRKIIIHTRQGGEKKKKSSSPATEITTRWLWYCIFLPLFSSVFHFCPAGKRPDHRTPFCLWHSLKEGKNFKNFNKKKWFLSPLHQPPRHQLISTWSASPTLLPDLLIFPPFVSQNMQQLMFMVYAFLRLAPSAEHVLTFFIHFHLSYWKMRTRKRRQFSFRLRDFLIFVPRLLRDVHSCTCT